MLACVWATLLVANLASAEVGVQAETRVWDFEEASTLNVCSNPSASPRLHRENQLARSELALGSPHAARGIGATGKLGEAALKALGGESQVAFRTSVGRRVVDQLVNGIAHESKVGYASLTKGIAGQIAKDAELMASGEIRGATWHFFRSSVTGKIGPSAPLRQALGDAGIGIVMH